MALRRLTLGELRSAASAFKTVFLPFLAAGVAGEHAGDLEGGTLLAGLEQGAGDAKADGLGLSGESAALDVGLDVVAVLAVNEGERLLEVEDEGRERHVFVDVVAVDEDLAFAGFDVDAGDRGFAAAGSVIFGFSHLSSPYLLRSRATGF